MRFAAAALLIATTTLPAMAADRAVNASATPSSDAAIDARAAKIVDAMTLDEQISLMRTQVGFGFLSLGVPLPDSLPAFMKVKTPIGALGSAGYVAAIPRVGLPALQLADASLGVANMGGFLRLGDEATSLPSSLALAAAFDPDLARDAGALLGAEAHAKGFNVQLAGGVNLTRDPRSGRNFEYAGEDPLLAGTTIGSQVGGVQSSHVVSTLKHFAINDQETGRMVYDAVIGETAARESDLLAFEIALHRGKPGAVMCAYNRVNGHYACENDFLLHRVLRGDWGFKGWVMSDWGATHSLKPSLDAGLDQESPQEGEFFTKIRPAVDSGEIPASRVRESAFRIVCSLIAAGALDNPAVKGTPIDPEVGAAVAERVALAGSVLLKNDGLLPVAASAKRIVVIGGFANRGVLSGGGSSQVMPYGGHFLDTRGRSGAAAIMAPVYGLSSPLEALRKLRPDADIRFDDGTDVARAAALAKSADLAIVFATRPEEEGGDSATPTLPFNQDALIAAVGAANPRTTVVLETGNPIVMPWLGRVGAVLQAWYPGQRGGEAIAKLLTGAVAPSGRLPMTFPVSVDQLPRPKIPGKVSTETTPLGMGDMPPPFKVEMTEGSDVGYRWFERTHAKPMFPFGFGLTYTTFAYSGLRVAGGDTLSTTFTLRNTGKRDGIEVAQLYVAPPGRTHRLAGWARVALKPGETRTVTIDADPRLLASYDQKAGRWHRAAGKYDLYVGRASGSMDLPGKATLVASSNINRDGSR